MVVNAQKTPAEIRTLREQHPKMREREFARIHGVSEAELVAAHVGQGVRRLQPDVARFLAGIGAVGEVMALTRNESAVHEKIGVYENAKAGQHNAIVLGDDIDLRIFPGKWASAFAVEKRDDDGAIKRSLQFFDPAGDAVHKVHLRPASDLVAYEALVDTLMSDDQSQTLVTEPVLPGDRVAGDKVSASREELRESWSKMTDTHQFFPMLKRLNLTRHQAMHMVGHDYAWPLDLCATQALLNGAAGSDLPIMVFIGNAGCIQIHSGPIDNVSLMGPWINILDEKFHMHLRLDQIVEVWGVRKPTADGHVTSVECYGADNSLIIQFFGQRQEGVDERSQWRALVEGLPDQPRSTAA